MRLEKPFLFVFFFILATVPLLFGARHPLIHGLYSFLLLLAGGSLLVLNYQGPFRRILVFNRLAPLLILLFIGLSAAALPLFLLGAVSPVRAQYLADAVTFADLRDAVPSLSYYAPGSMFYAVYGMALMLFFYASRYVLASEKTLRRTLWIITIVGLFEAVYGLLQATNPALGVLWLPGSFAYEGTARGTIIYRNQYAALMNLCWPMAVVLGITMCKPALEKLEMLRRKDNTLSLVDRTSFLFQKATIPFWSAGLMILAIVFSRSRGGILVMLSIAALFIYLLPFFRRIKSLYAVLLLVFVGFYGGIIGFAGVIERFTYFYASALNRIDIWYGSAAMLKDHLLTGIGMGGYEFLSPVYLTNVPAAVWYDRAHNEYVELAIELGLPMMLLFLAWVFIGIAGYGANILKKKKIRLRPVQMQTNDIVTIGAFCALVGFLLHAGVDFIWRLPANVIYAVVILAVLSSIRVRGGKAETFEAEGC
ncbi:MAG: O-antigen ligase family protein [Desulfobulbaceae bacterium]|nr:O-antigen ligase family protein [Desulfobulbaceae bacterium]